MIDSDLYHRFARGEASDLEVVDRVFDRLGTKDLQERHGNTLFEAVIIVAAQEDQFGGVDPADTMNSQLLQRYQALVDDEKPDSASPDPERRYASAVP